jgi:hypothetical protein
MIEATQRVFPEFLIALDREVFPTYRRAADGASGPYCRLADAPAVTTPAGHLGATAADPSFSDLRAMMSSSAPQLDIKYGYDFDAILWDWKYGPFEQLSDDGPLKAALTEWANNFNAYAPWLLNGALRTLRDWDAKPVRHKAREWLYMHVEHETQIEADFKFEYGAWRPQDMLWSQYRATLRKQLEKELAQYGNGICELAESAGLNRAQRKYSPVNLEWFALYQFAKKSSTDIADLYHGKHDESSVLKGIHAAANLLCWERLRRSVKDCRNPENWGST